VVVGWILCTLKIEAFSEQCLKTFNAHLNIFFESETKVRNIWVSITNEYPASLLCVHPNLSNMVSDIYKLNVA